MKQLTKTKKPDPTKKGYGRHPKNVNTDVFKSKGPGEPYVPGKAIDKGNYGIDPALIVKLSKKKPKKK